LYLSRNPEHPFFEKWRELAAVGKSDDVRVHYAKLFADAAIALKEATAKEAAKPKQAATPKEAPPKGAKAKAKDEPVIKPADPTLAAAHDALNDIAGFLAIPDKDADAFDESMLTTAEKMRDELMALEDKTPEPPAFMGVRDGTIAKALPIHLRGSYLTLGKEVERAFPEVMRASLTRPVLPVKQSGRLELARWMAGSEHPLTARVMVNRIWRWHFGRGIIGSTDNFGVLGDKPSHAALLDWLARTFIENGWSVKDMHRLIMKSSAYQMASTHPSAGQPSSGPDPAMLDPENKLLWRANIQRLEAEEIRDAMLAASGSLSKEVGGKTVPLRNREFVFNHTSRDHTTYESPRRGLYLPIIRNHLYDMLEQFDYPDPTMPTGSRNSTVVAPQALIMLNSPVAIDAGDKLAAKLCSTDSSDEARVQQAYDTLYARPAAAQEVSRALAFVQKHSDRRAAWSLLCHTLMAANEFMYLR
jgi:hypothetical protein